VWCDTTYAFTGGERMTIDDVIRRVDELRSPLVEVTGGEPLAQPGCLELLERLCNEGYEVLLETSGALDISRVDPRVVKIVDVKCPGSGESESNRWENLAALTARDELKFVIADRRDYEWARGVLANRKLASLCSVIHFSPAHKLIDPTRLAGWIRDDLLPVRLQLQLHKYLWPGEERGV
jgi:7-carboxy-7-deazaguanine synthase